MGEELNWFGRSIFSFEGISRWQLWFDNPNKAGILFAELAVLGIWVFVRAPNRHWIKWVGGLLAFCSGFGLMHTLSRGGLLAFAVGSVIVVGGEWWRRRADGSERKWRLDGIFLLVLLVFFFACAKCFRLDERCFRGVAGNDASVANRIAVWKSVPSMMLAAPDGWGMGKSGEAYMQWFQPPERIERYRTLVNSHFTWMVELGWLFSCAYVILWLLAFYLGTLILREGGNGILLSQLLILFVGGMCSSVLEAKSIWLFPILAAVLSFSPVFHIRQIKVKVLFAVICGGICVLCIILACGLMWERPMVRKGKNLIDYGTGSDFVGMVILDESVIGGRLYPRQLRRESGKKSEPLRICITDSTANFPRDSRRIVACGGNSDQICRILSRFPEAQVRLLSPSCSAGDLAMIAESEVVDRIGVGEFSPDFEAEISDLRKVVVQEGVRIYLPDWVSLAFSGW